ncbi:MAG: transposase [Anaerolineales bacterium]
MLRRLDKSYAAFFRRLKAGQKPGFPRFKNRNRFKSVEYTYGDGCKLRQDGHGRMRFYIQNVAEMRMCYHRSIPLNAEIKHAVVKQVGERWYVHLMLALPEAVTGRIPTGQQVGVDVGLKSLAALSSGELIENPGWLRKSLAQLRRIQRHAARQVRGSHRQGKTCRQMTRLHQRVSSQRADYLHQVSHRLVADNDLIAIENLALSFMNRNSHMSLASYDTGFALFRQMLEYKAEEAGIPVIAVNPANTSQVCSACGSIVPKDLSVRVHACPDCALVLDRDVNAARNILALALHNPLGRSGQPVTWPVGASVG